MKRIALFGFLAFCAGCSRDKAPAAPVSNAATEYGKSLAEDPQKARLAVEKANRAIAESQNTVDAAKSASE